MMNIEAKKPLNPRILLLAVAMTAFTFSHAFAATPRTESVVVGDHVTLADVFDDVTENAGYVLAPAPAFGKTLTLGTHDLVRIANAFNLDWQPLGAPQQVVIRRAFDEVGTARIKSAIIDKLATQLNGQRLDVEFHDPAVSLRTAGADTATLDIEDLRLDAARGEFRAVISAGDARRTVTGRFYSMVSLPVLKAPLRPGDVIAAQDIDYVNVRAADVAPSMVVDAARLIGMTPRRGLASLRPLTMTDVQSPVLVKKGETVTMSLQTGGIVLTTQGRALDNGAAGDLVRILNTSSNQTVDAVITGPQAVSVRPVTGTL